MRTSTSDRPSPPPRGRALLAGTALREALAARALSEGFDAIGIAAPDAIPEAADRLRAFLAAGHHASMAWMAERAEQRGDPRRLWPEVRSVVMLGLNYGPDRDPREALIARRTGTISVYARGDDYHDVVKKKLKAIGQWLGVASGEPLKLFVDTAPVMEKPLAEAAGLGWQGKHTNLVSRSHGSWLFLGAILTSAAMEPDRPERDHCGSCRACLDACPTRAFPEPYRLDAGRCISYLTIEHKGPIAVEFRAAIGNRIYGCDDCLAVCPWNKFAALAREQRLAPRSALVEPSLAELARLDDTAFRALFAKSPVKRIGRDRFLRNVLIAIGNSADAALAAEALRLLDDPSPLVRGAAVWAAGRLDEAALRSQAWRSDHEQDMSVLEEWTLQLPRGGGRSRLDVPLHSADTNGAVRQSRDGDDSAARGAQGVA
jgi:epoxyqueuosine reductase